MKVKKLQSLKSKNSGKKLIPLGYLLLIFTAFIVAWVPSAIAADARGSNYALWFDGKNDFVSIPVNNGDFDFDSNFSVEAWVKPMSLGSTNHKGLVRGAFDEPPGITHGWVLYLDNIDNSRWGLSVCTPGCNSAESGTGGLQVGRWDHLAVTYNGILINIYQNGILIDSQSKTENVSDINYVLFGFWDTYFNGYIDEVRIWNTTILPVQITNFMNRTVRPSDSEFDNLVGYWRFDEGMGQTVLDSTANGNDGRLGASDCVDDADPIRVLSDAPIATFDDSDGDGQTDYDDNCPANNNLAQLDSDNDGIGDVCDIPITGAVHHVHQPDGRLRTYLEVMFDPGFPPNLPDDIDTISVTGPDGPLPITKEDFTYYPQWTEFFINLPGSPAVGPYIFTVKSGDSLGQTQDTQDDVKILPLPDTSGFLPTNHETIYTTTPTFSWPAMTYPATTIYYRLQIRDMDQNQVYTTARVQDMTSHTVPLGELDFWKTYEWRVRLGDNPDWIVLDNRSQSEWFRFSIADNSGVPGSISGRVITPDNKPIENLLVQAFYKTCWNIFLANAWTDSNGEYVLDGLPPGPVYVGTCPQCDQLNYINKWWTASEGTINCSLAQPVAVNSAQIRENVDFTLKRGPQRMQWVEVVVANGTLDTGFQVKSGFRDQLVAATLTIPNLSRDDYPVYTYNLDTDLFDLWDSECRFIDAWIHNFGPAEAGDYGEYIFTLNFQDGTQEIYRYNLDQVSVTPASNIAVAVNDDGSVYASWIRGSPPAPQKYQVRVREVGSGREIFNSTRLLDEDELLIPAEDLRCLTKGESYRWLVRAYDYDQDPLYPYDPDYNTKETQEITAPYSPTCLLHTVRSNAYAWRGEAAQQYRTRPGSKDDLQSLYVTGPEGSGFSYTFNLTDDWYDISSESTLGSNGWWHQFDPYPNPIPFGAYVFYGVFADGRMENNQDTLQDVPVTAVVSSTMDADINPDGSVFFSWVAPVVGQTYQVRVRSLDDDIQYYHSGNLFESEGNYADAWALRDLEPGQEYRWFVRAYDPDFNTMEQSASLTFTYNAFDADGDGVLDSPDNCPDDYNSGQENSDTDTFGDACDNCPDDYNPGQDDIDYDGIGSVCDPCPNELPTSVPSPADLNDFDNDGLCYQEEIALGSNPNSNDSDGDTRLDGEDYFPADPDEWADFDGDGIGDNGDNCPERDNGEVTYNAGDSRDECASDAGLIDAHGNWQPDYDCDTIGDDCDDDADDDGSNSAPEGDDCDDFDENVYPGCPDTTPGCPCEGPVGSEAPPAGNCNANQDCDGDGVKEKDDNCPGLANDQTDSDLDDKGDACDNCPLFPNEDQTVPVWHKDHDNDGYHNGDTVTQCEEPTTDTYKLEADLLSMEVDCDDDNNNINPGAAPEFNCDPADDPAPPAGDYNIKVELQRCTDAACNSTESINYGSWDPADGDEIIVTFKAMDGSAEFSYSNDPNVMPRMNSNFAVGLAAAAPGTSNPTRNLGKYLNDTSENGLANPSADFDNISFGTNEIRFICRDFGGSITIHAEVPITKVDGTTDTLSGDFAFPKDSDGDGLPDFWESPKGNLIPSADLDLDGIPTSGEYRGVKWSKTVAVPADGITYDTIAYVPEGTPDGTVKHFRLDPQNHRDLFVIFEGFDAEYPFAVGAAFENLASKVAIHALEINLAGSLGQNNIDVTTVTLVDGVLGLENPHIDRWTTRSWTFSTLGKSIFGGDDIYGSYCRVFKKALDAFFEDQPHHDYTTFTGTRSNQMKVQSNWSGVPSGVLEAVANVEDGNDNGNKDSREDLTGNELIDGDHPVRNDPTGEVYQPGSPKYVKDYVGPDIDGDGKDDEWDFEFELSPFDINKNGMVELPVVGSIGEIETATENSKKQAAKMIVTHELGHNTGITLHTSDSNCAMNNESNNLIRDNHFSQAAAELVRIHNAPYQP